MILLHINLHTLSVLGLIGKTQIVLEFMIIIHISLKFNVYNLSIVIIVIIIIYLLIYLFIIYSFIYLFIYKLID
jgi:hypothetical protein